LVEASPTGEQGALSTVHSPLLRLAAQGAASVSFSSRRAYKATVSRLSAGAHPAADRWCFFVDKRVFLVVGYCSISMMSVLGVPLMKGSAVLPFSSRGPRPLPCACWSHEHVFPEPHALAGGGVRPACAATSRATVRPKSCAQYVDCDPSTPQLFWLWQRLDAARRSAGILIK